jgi:glycosyltransferase involved in cell wall biosynthesis
MLLLDLTHTSHTPARTGVQRVCRSLHAALARQRQVVAVTHDPYERVWRPLNDGEQQHLANDRPGGRRSAQWSWRARWAGRWRRWSRQSRPPLPEAVDGVLVPEIFSPGVAAALPRLFAAGRPRVAVFHDAIALRLPEYTPVKTVARFPAYLQELLAFDGITTVSEDSRAALVDYWQWLGVGPTPPVVAVPLGTNPVGESSVPTGEMNAANSKPLTVLCVGSVEGRKNHLALLNAAERLWLDGLVFELHLIGLPRPESAAAALERVAALQAQGRPLTFSGVVDEATLETAYARCAFTVYPSLMEGFGLPVIESLRHGRPCICSGRGALGESARGGGCLMLDEMSVGSLEAAIRQLLHSPAERHRLATEALARRFRTWDDYTTDLLSWMGTLPTSEDRPQLPQIRAGYFRSRSEDWNLRQSE